MRLCSDAQVAPRFSNPPGMFSQVKMFLFLQNLEFQPSDVRRCDNLCLTIASVFIGHFQDLAHDSVIADILRPQLS